MPEEDEDTRFLGPMSVKQSVYAAMAAAIILFLWMFSGIESLMLRAVITLAIFAATVFAISRI